MALVVFGEKIDFNSITPPEEGGYVVGYNIEDDLLSQMDYLGVVTAIGGAGGAGGGLSTTLALGNNTGTYSIVLDSSITKGTNKILLDDGRVSITTANGNYNESYLFMNSTDTILGNGSNKSFRIESTGITTKWSDTDRQTINANSYELFLNNLNTLQFGKLSSGAGSKLSALISTDNSTIVNGLVNTVVIGGQNIQALDSNSVYVPFLLIQDGKVIKGTKGSGQIQFTETGDVISSNSNSVIGVISSTSSIAFTQNGIFVKDSATASSSPNIDSGITYVSTRNSSATASIINSVVIGGQGLIATASDTVYLGNNVNINNAFTLPTTDGSIGQVLKTDGLGNVTWGVVSATLNLVTLGQNQFANLSGVFEVDTTYVITDADTSLYGGTEIYLTTNSNGVLNDEGIGKFYNPNYNTGTAGNGIFTTSSTHAINSITIWGGYVWQNTTGTTGTASDIFTLNSTNWTQIPFDEVYYTISYDKIKYDWENNLIVYRNEKNTNIVSTSKSNIDTFKNINTLFNPIKAFQWGNVYSFTSLKGIGSQNIINSYNENINFRGNAQVNITMNNLSAQYNLVISTNRTQSNLVFSNYLYNRQSILLSTDENGLVFQGNLPQQSPTTLVGKLNNQQVEIDLATTGLVTPVITSRWSIFNSNGVTPFGPTSIGGTIVGTFSTSNFLTVPIGCRVSFTGTSSIPAATTGFSTPTTRTGSFTFSSSTYPVVSATLSTAGLSANTTYTTILTKPRTGLIVSGLQVTVATGSDTTSATTQVIFNDLFYFGYLNVGLPNQTITASAPYVDGITASQIEGLGNYRFGGKAQTFVSNDGNTGSRLVFAYRESYGLLSTLVVQGEATLQTNAFTRRTNPLVITTLSGMTMSYHVYVANADNTWGNGVPVTLVTT
jgi:hypothetical protein